MRNVRSAEGVQAGGVGAASTGAHENLSDASRQLTLSLWGIPLVLAACQIPFFLLGAFIIDPGQIAMMSAVGFAAFLLSRHFLSRPEDRMLGHLIALPCIMLATSVSFVALALMSVSFSLPLQDEILNRIDLALGFDWSAYREAMLAHPLLLRAASFCYRQLDHQAVLIVMILAVWARVSAAQTFILAWTTALVIVIVISIALPALGAFEYLGIEPDLGHIKAFRQIRLGLVAYEPYKGLMGPITFPSFHACGGVLLAWGFWQIRLLRWPMLVLNLGLIAAAPVFGSHYLVDILAGALIAPVAIMIARGIAHVALSREAGPAQSFSPGSSGAWLTGKTIGSGRRLRTTR